MSRADPAHPALSPPTPKLSPSALRPIDQLDEVEVSMVEAEDVTGVTFVPELWMQRRQWALEVLRRERVRSVLDIGCGPGALLETLVIPSSTIVEPPVRSRPKNSGHGQPPSPVDSADDEESGELFIARLAALDCSPNVIPSALSVITPPSPSSTFPPPRPRWEELHAELWLGGIEKYNSRLEGYEAIVGLELIEHLDPNVLSRFGVVTMGTYRPRLLLVTTPNFDFNAKFPVHEHDHDDFAHRGFADPTGRTDRVFRHSDHKLEMTAAEFRDWAEGAAADWGYTVEVSGVGVSSKPSYYPADPSDPSRPPRPIYATSTAIFRLASGVPTRSPRSVRSSELPFLSKESSHPHKLAGKFVHPVHAPGDGRKHSPEDVRALVQSRMEEWRIGVVSVEELWAVPEIAGACAGSKRYFLACVGGYGDVPAQGGEDEYEVGKIRGMSLAVRWKRWEGEEGVVSGEVSGQDYVGRGAASGPETGGW